MVEVVDEIKGKPKEDVEEEVEEEEVSEEVSTVMERKNNEKRNDLPKLSIRKENYQIMELFFKHLKI